MQSCFLWGSGKNFFPFCMVFYLQLRMTKIQINIWPNDTDINQYADEFLVSTLAALEPTQSIQGVILFVLFGGGGASRF